VKARLVARSATWYSQRSPARWRRKCCASGSCPRHHLLPLALDDPRRSQPGQQIDVRLVLGQDHRAFGQGGDLLVERRQDGGLLGVALGHQPRPAPVGLLAHSPGQGRQGHRRTAQCAPQLPDRPRPRLPKQHPNAPAEPGASQARRARPRSVLHTGHALVVVAIDPAANGARVVREEGGDLGGGQAAQGEPDHDQAEGEAPGTLEQGRDLELVIGGGLGEDVSMTQRMDMASWTLWKAPTRLLFFAAPLPWRG
jgi:hypothetical protein